MSAPQEKEAIGTNMDAPSQVEAGDPLKIDVKNTDAAAVYLNETEHYEPLSPQEEKKLKRKIDFVLLPMVCFASLSPTTSGANQPKY